MTRKLCNSVALLGLFALVGVAQGQVFTQDADAVVGPTNEGDGQALYGDFGLNSASDPEFKIYRKMSQRDTAEPLSSATNVDGNPGEVEWINVNQRQGVPEGPNYVLTAPGMFIGQKNHKTADGWTVSNPNEILYLKPLIDNQGPNGDNPGNGVATGDSNNNANWDTRFGFMENPDAFLDFAEGNSGDMDLWTGDFATDAVYLQNAVRRDDSTSDSVTQATGHGGSFKLHAEPSSFADERERMNNETTRVRAGSGEVLEPNGHADAGVALGDAIEVTWGMRLNDPENEDPFLAREVEFWVKTGSNIASGVFDPGAPGSEPVDDVNSDFEIYSDDFFDWENAFPVFFAGAQGRAQGTGGMGIFIPGDFGADGAVDASDFTRLAANFGQAGTTYSRGDFTQDGITDLDDATAWAGLADDAVKTAAVGLVEGDIGGSAYDFDGSGGTDAADVTLISELFGVGGGCVPSMGDIDGSGTVDFTDFLVLSANFGTGSTAAEGDIDCDGSVAFGDFLILSSNFGQAVGAQSVPEPNGAGLMLLGVLAMFKFRRKRA